MKIKCTIKCIQDLVSCPIFNELMNKKCKDIFSIYKIHSVLKSVKSEHENISESVRLLFANHAENPEDPRLLVRQPYSDSDEPNFPNNISEEKKEEILKARATNKQHWESLSDEEKEKISKNWIEFNKEFEDFSKKETEFEFKNLLDIRHLIQVGMEISPQNLSDLDIILDKEILDKWLDANSNDKK